LRRLRFAPAGHPPGLHATSYVPLEDFIDEAMALLLLGAHAAGDPRRA